MFDVYIVNNEYITSRIAEKTGLTEYASVAQR